MMNLETLRISVRPSPTTNSHELILATDAGDLVRRFGVDELGLDPLALLFEPCPLVATSTPRTVRIGRCTCGVIECSPVRVDIVEHDGVVSWTSKTIEVRFAATQYAAEVERALSDQSWETPERTAARLIASRVDHARLARAGFEFEWASGRVHANAMTVSLQRVSGRDQVLVEVPWRDESPVEIAELALTSIQKMG